MKNNMKKHTKKNKVYKTNKYYKGGNLNTNFEPKKNNSSDTNYQTNNVDHIDHENNINNLYNIDDINEQVQKENTSTFLSSNSGILNKASALAQNIGINTIESIGDKLGFDLKNTTQVNQKLRQVNDTLSNPQNIEQVKEIISNAAEIGAVGIEAAKPFIDPLIDTTIEKTKEAASKIGEAGVKIALNTATEIPGIGVVVGTIRSLSNAAEAGLAAINAGNEITKTTANTINASTKNFNRLMREKKNILERTQNSVNNFMEPQKMNMTMRKGGRSKKGKKSKKIRKN
jgi:hypothetical protein